MKDAHTVTQVSYAALSDSALLGKLIGAREVKRFYQGSLGAVFNVNTTPIPDRCGVARELVKRWLVEELRRDTVLNVPRVVADYLRIHFAGQEHESFVVLFLDAQHHLIAPHVLFRGTLTHTSVYPREIVKAALYANAAAVMFAHNHPSGLAEPSHADRHLTEALKNALALVDVRVLDHFVVAGSQVVSFAELGLL